MIRTFGLLISALLVLFAQRADANDRGYRRQSPWEPLDVSQSPAATRAEAMHEGEDVDASVPVSVCGQLASRLTSVRRDPEGRIRILRQIVT